MGAPKLTNESIASRLDELPTLPTVATELGKVINDPLASSKDVEKVMSGDQSLTTKVLRLVNSAYYGIPGGVTNLNRAIAYLGFDTINQVVLTASIFSALKVNGDPVDFEMKAFWQHSVGVGMAAQAIGQAVKYQTPADLFTCGLIHDMGKVALFVLDPHELSRIATHARTNDKTFQESELELESVQHATIGRMLAEKWKLPVLIQNAIQHHHQTNPLKRGGISPELQQVVDITLLANLLVHALKYGHSGHSKIVNAPADLFERLHISQDSLKPLFKSIKDALQNADAFINLISEKK
jgi:HD-like signal output (HDOD) protein